ncbi:hypothetical protein Skr01_11430 [Sphaerisporangium krabiense]|uniref:DNA-binding MarR family transcriptional regulator n=1 Tax=Sphaerisporangium krabiense TaxID=763782 RepID=A0A7W9DU73_9ACTN|nr:MarR family transcriptional regulator [Sphaerisporangium krabiense]MBB5631642.1 DNA-binding MarR family transcriptional regulator [Sphaerisporangium krabiense]GII61058.1 hypothetical protein Skr01_11430 [Sphaerisporangium krabiense]
MRRDGEAEPAEDTTLTALLGLSVGNMLRRVFMLFTAEAMREGPQSRDFVVLDTLADQDGHSQQDLAEKLGINRTIMVRLIDRLEEAGHVTRTRNPANRRSYVLTLTPAGRAARDAMRRPVSDRDARVTAALTSKERARLAALLAKMLPEPESPAVQSIEYLVTQAYHRLRRQGDVLLSGAGLRTRHFGPLSALALLAPCPQQELARHLNITEPSAAQVIDELAEAGLVTRGRDPRDRRRYALELTPLGRDRLTDVRAAMVGLRAEVIGLLGAAPEEELRALLTKLLSPAPGAPRA